MVSYALTLQQLKYLVAMQEASTLSSAARNLDVKLPSLSVALRRIEKEVGVQLTNRSPRPHLTSAGHVLANCARIVLREGDQAIETARNTPNTAAASTPPKAEAASWTPLTVAPSAKTRSRPSRSRAKSAEAHMTIAAVPPEAASASSVAQQPTGRVARRTWVGKRLDNFEFDYAHPLHRLPPVSEVASGFRMRLEVDRPAELNDLKEKQLTLRWVAEDGFTSRMNADHLCAIPVFADSFHYVAFESGKTFLEEAASSSLISNIVLCGSCPVEPALPN